MQFYIAPKRPLSPYIFFSQEVSCLLVDFVVEAENIKGWASNLVDQVGNESRLVALVKNVR